MENMDIQIIKSRRRTVSIEVHTDGSVILRAPNRMTKKELDIFIDKHMSWIESKQQLMKERKEEKIPTNAKAFDMLTPKERAVIRDTFIRKVEYYSKIMNVTVGRVTIRNQKTRWGSCSSKGNLNFNCLLMLAPPEVLDSVVVHELCHRREMNHSQKFYAEVLRVFPTYRTQEKWLKEHGGELLKRLRD